MGNTITFISWSHGEYDANIMQEFIRIRRALRIAGSYESPLNPIRPERCYVAGETNQRLADKWLTLCRRFVRNNPCYRIAPNDVNLTMLNRKIIG